MNANDYIAALNSHIIFEAMIVLPREHYQEVRRQALAGDEQALLGLYDAEREYKNAAAWAEKVCFGNAVDRRTLLKVRG